MKLQNFVKFLLIPMVFIGLVFPLHVSALDGFRVRVEYLDNSKFPQVDAYISVSDANGFPIKDLKQDAFVFTEDGSLISIQSFHAVKNKEQPLSIALLIDTSESMRGKTKPTAMQKSIEAAAAFVGQLAPKDRVSVIKFSDKPEEVISLTDDKTRVVQAIQSLEPEGRYTSLYDAVVKGISTLKTQSGRRIIVLITDGKDTNTGLYKSDDAIRELSATDIPVYPMGFGNVVNVSDLKKMADLTGGSAKILPSVLDLSKSFDEVLDSLRQQYLVRYISSFPADDKQHEILVSATYGGGQESTSHLYIAKSSSIPISMLDIQPGQTVGGLVNFSFLTDWPPEIIKSMDISVDGAPISIIKSPTDDFVYGWNSFDAGITPGTHEFKAKINDVGGNTGQTSISLNVQPPISAEIVSPQDGDSLSGTLQITAKVAALPGITLSRLSFVVDNQEIASVTADPAKTEYTVDWATSEAGRHPVKVIAYEASGLFTTESKTIFVNASPGGFGGLVVIVVLAFAALVVPFAIRSRKRRGMAVASGVAVAGAVSGKTVLYELEGVSPNQIRPLGVADVKLGRKRGENDIPLKGLTASRYHAVIRFEQGQHFIYCINAENPVIVNDLPVAQKQALVRGDIIRLGETVLRFDS